MCYYCNRELNPEYDYFCNTCEKQSCDGCNQACGYCDDITCGRCITLHIENSHPEAVV